MDDLKIAGEVIIYFVDHAAFWAHKLLICRRAGPGVTQAEQE